MFGKVIDEADMKDLEEMKAHDVGLKMMQTKAGNKNPFDKNFHPATSLKPFYEKITQSKNKSKTCNISHMGDRKRHWHVAIGLVPPQKVVQSKKVVQQEKDDTRNLIEISTFRAMPY